MCREILELYGIRGAGEPFLCSLFTMIMWMGARSTYSTQPAAAAPGSHGLPTATPAIHLKQHQNSVP